LYSISLVYDIKFQTALKITRSFLTFPNFYLLFILKLTILLFWKVVVLRSYHRNNKTQTYLINNFKMLQKSFLILALYSITFTSVRAQDDDISPISGEIIQDIIQSIPSPLEISSLIKTTETNYNPEILSSHTFVSNYNTSFKQALNLGVYSTDLGYANIYGKNQDAINYLNSVKKLSDNMSIGPFFDYNTIKKLAQNGNNLDSLLQKTQQNIEKINLHLQEQRRENLSILMVTGAWAEALYLSTLVYQQTKEQALKERIGEQKIALEQILLVLDVYKTKPNFSALIEDLKELTKIYRNVEINVTKGDPIMVVRDDEIVIEQHTVTEVEITEQQVESIASMIKSIRNKIVR